ncbi:MAG: hypothetical protein FJ221_09720 [Lentisphaerae bacterium]|nr:hypothetical protein [Lentisphaerota bacterium]
MRAAALVSAIGLAVASNPWTAGAQDFQALDAARAGILGGAKEIPATGAVGLLSVFGPQAATLFAGERAGVLGAAAALGFAGRGRVVALAHDGYLAGAAGDEAVGGLIERSLRWAAGAPGTGAIPVAVRSGGGLKGWLAKRGFAAADLQPESLAAARAVIVVGRQIDDAMIEPLRAFVEKGGGLVVGETAWSWRSGGSEVRNHPANRLCAPWGILWTDGIVEGTAGKAFRADPAPLCHAGAALALATDAAAKPSKQDLKQAGVTLSDASGWIPADDRLLRPRLAAAVTALESPYPASGKPVKSTEVLRRVATSMGTVAAMGADVDAVAAHSAAAAFPGAVSSTVERVSREVVLDLRKPGWASTGLYAAPGERLAVTVPAALAGAKLRVRIGAHSDRLWHLDSWKRCPDITRTFPVTAERTAAANAFGGLLYVESPGGAGDGASRVRISGAVDAPLYVRGRTTAAEWRVIRDRPAPWGELATDKVILTVPSDRLRKLDDPETLLEVWDRILDAQADLAAIPRDRARPERIVPDIQISAGYMHAGYPIMTWDDQYDVLVSRDALLKGQWGLFHELGHNHQQRDWTFDGTGEVTVNLFSLYVMETVCGKPPVAGHGAIEPAARAKAWARYASAGRKFDDWKSDPFLALNMYAQLREAFGWEAFKRVFAEYRDLAKEARPRTDDDRRDQWMVRLSRTVNRNLGPFFEAWAVPTSPTARDSIAQLPAWMPAGWPPAPAGAE